MRTKLLDIFVIIIILAAGMYSFNYLDYVQKMNPQILIKAVTTEEAELGEGFHGGKGVFPGDDGDHRAERGLPEGGGFHQREGDAALGAGMEQVLAFAGVFAFTVTITSILDRKRIHRNAKLAEIDPKS